MLRTSGFSLISARDPWGDLGSHGSEQNYLPLKKPSAPVRPGPEWGRWGRGTTSGGMAGVAVRDGADSHQGSSTCGSNKYLGSVCSLLFLQIQRRSMILQNTIEMKK